jgi:two-component system response regulator PilR (NtrC family)
MPDNANAEAAAGSMTPSVLVVDDEGDLRMAIRDVLSMQGCWVDTAASAAEALRYVLSRNYQIVVSDIRLPEMDGLELARLLSRRVHSPRIILMTAFGSPEIVKEAYAAGASHYMPKPISLATLSRLVKQLAETPAEGDPSVRRS